MAGPAVLTVADTIARSIPGAELVELADCGHVTYAEQPAAFADVLAPSHSRFAALSSHRPTTRDQNSGWGVKPSRA